MRVPGARKRAARGDARPPGEWEWAVDLLAERQTDETGGSGVVGLHKLAVVDRCVNFLGHSVSTMPRRVVGEKGDEMPVPPWLLHPHATLTGNDLIFGGVFDLLTAGNWYPLPHRNGAGDVVSVIPPRARDVGVSISPSGHYVYYIGSAEHRGEMYHARYACRPGEPLGYSAMAAMAGNVAISTAAQTVTVQHFKQGLVSPYVIVSQNPVSDVVKKSVKKDLVQHHAGAKSAHRPLLLTGGVDIKTVSTSAQDSELMALMQYSDAQIAQAFGVDPSLVGIVQGGSSLTYANQQDNATAFWRNTLQPLVVRIETVLSMLLPDGQSLDLDERSMLLGSMKDRSAMLSRMPGSVFTLNERRALLNYPPLKSGGDELASPPAPPAAPPAEADGRTGV